MGQTTAEPTLDLGRCLNDAMEVYRKNFLTFVLAVILFDVVLGFGSHDNPAQSLALALADAQRDASAQGRTLALIGHVCGTDGDPQDRAAQVRALEAAGAIIAGSNVEAFEETKHRWQLEGSKGLGRRRVREVEAHGGLLALGAARRVEVRRQNQIGALRNEERQA